VLNIELINKVEKYVTDLILKIQSDKKFYHGMIHTLDVVKVSKEIAIAESVTESDIELVTIAAWFHDTGYMFCSDGHEEQSSLIAREFLEKESYPSDKINIIVQCINATAIPQNPSNLLEEILCDADLYHLGMPDSEERSKLLRKELEETGNKEFSDIEWYKISYKFIRNHSYFTPYANKNFNAQKLLNLKKLESKIKILEIA